MDEIKSDIKWLFYSIIIGFFTLFLKSHVSQRKSEPTDTPTIPTENAKSSEADIKTALLAALVSIASSQDEKGFPKRPRRHNRFQQ